MKRFFAALRDRNPNPDHREWLFVPYDQLSDRIGPLAREAPETLGIVLVEAPWRADRRPYHKQKLLTILASQRHFALEQATRGIAVKYVIADTTYASALRDLTPMRMMEAAERELRTDVSELTRAGLLTVLPHEGWLTSRAQFLEHAGAVPWRMDAFYKGVREDTGILMENGRPVGGRYSFDTENRQPWNGTPPAPKPPVFAVDAVTDEVVELLQTRFDHHPGEPHPEYLPATADDARALWRNALVERLPFFGPYEDAMAAQEPGLFHSRVSAMVNIHRLLPRELLDDVVAANIPLPSKEGFVRQLLGWREYMHHVHVETDGFRTLPPSKRATAAVGKQIIAAQAGDGGYERWSGRAWPASTGDNLNDGGAVPSFMDSHTPVPPAYWGKPSGLACLDHVVSDVWRDGYSHHITRLMVLSNIAQLLDIEPRELTDWFWAAYIDAYDWVVEPNVLMMSTFSVGELGTTKPYISGAPYINKLSDYCEHCAFDPKLNCPLTPMYWAYLARHAEKLASNPRVGRQAAAARAREVEKREDDVRVFETVRDTLVAGATVTLAMLDGALRRAPVTSRPSTRPRARVKK
ncbi:MAG: cryptochrome/photolyase family protein [Clostridia bacterium]|nr:cryptochrome/photolyase family protein [Deltaproteobacteria bacterium]